MTRHRTLPDLVSLTVPDPRRSSDRVAAVVERTLVSRVPGTHLWRPRWEARVPTHGAAGSVRGWTRADALARMSARLRRIGAQAR